MDVRCWTFDISYSLFAIISVPEESSPTAEAPPVRAARTWPHEFWGLAFLFGAIYFIQGIAEPTEGLISQPIKSWMRSWNAPPGQIGWFTFLIGLPWMVKPLWGILVDLVPMPWGGRRGHLLVASAMTTGALAFLYLHPPEPGQVGLLLPWLLIACIGVAMSDVVADALMVEKGQPHGITGTLQSIQWTAIYSATILTTSLGGYLSEYGLQRQAFLICAAFMALTFLLALFGMRARPRAAARSSPPMAQQPSPPLANTPGGADDELVHRLRAAGRAIVALARHTVNPVVLLVAVFLSLWNFNPFSNNVLQLQMTEHLGMSQSFYGNTGSMIAVGSVIGSAAYGLYCRRVPFTWLVHLSIVIGIVATIAYWLLMGPISAMVISFVVGFTYMTGTLIQLDVAARVCPPAAAGTVFALLMSVTNASLSLATWWGSELYEAWIPRWGATNSFNLLVLIGAAATALSWVLVPALNRYARSAHEG